MSKYDAVAQRTLAAIQKAGAIVTFPGTGAGGIYDPATDQWSGEGSEDATGRAVQIEGDPNTLIALELIKETSVTLMIAASGLAVSPAPGMSILWAGVTYSVEAVDTVAPDGVPILFTVIGSA